MQTVKISEIKYLNFNNKNIPFLFINGEFFLELKEVLGLLSDATFQHRVTKAQNENKIAFQTDERPTKYFVSLETAEKEMLAVILKNDIDFDIENFKKSLFTCQNLVYKTRSEIENEFNSLTVKFQNVKDLLESTKNENQNAVKNNTQLKNEVFEYLEKIKSIENEFENYKNQSVIDYENTNTDFQKQVENLKTDYENQLAELKSLISSLENKIAAFEADEKLRSEKTQMTIWGEKIEDFFSSKFLPYYGFLALFGVMGVFSWFVLFNFLHLGLENYPNFEKILVGILSLLFAVVFELCMMIFSLKGMIKSKWVLLITQFIMVGLKTKIFVLSFYSDINDLPSIIFAWLITFILPYLQFTLSEIIRLKK